jgi:hypothetical protein
VTVTAPAGALVGPPFPAVAQAWATGLVGADPGGGGETVGGGAVVGGGVLALGAAVALVAVGVGDTTGSVIRPRQETEMTWGLTCQYRRDGREHFTCRTSPATSRVVADGGATDVPAGAGATDVPAGAGASAARTPLLSEPPEQVRRADDVVVLTTVSETSAQEKVLIFIARLARASALAKKAGYDDAATTAAIATATATAWYRPKRRCLGFAGSDTKQLPRMRNAGYQVQPDARRDLRGGHGGGDARTAAAPVRPASTNAA